MKDIDLQTSASTQDGSLSGGVFSLREVQPGSHIYTADHALDTTLCAEMIERFELDGDGQYPGRTGQLVAEDFSIKRSTDLVVSGKSHWRDVDQKLFESLALVMSDMRKRQAFFRGRFKDFGYAIQKTAAGEFYHWHVDGGSHSFSERMLVAIWYLNDVAGPGGETEFRHQKIKVKPKAGRVLVFPPFWTHEHRGVTLQRGCKYIATTWVLFA